MKKTFGFVWVLLLFLLLLSAAPSIHAAGMPGVSAKGALLMEADSGRVLYELNPDQQLPMASTTKIMTALLVLEAAETENRVIKITKEMVAVEGTSMGLLPGDRPTLVDLATGMLLASGNDAANAGAIAVGGSVNGFAEMMNRKAKELGMKNSSFVTPSGLDADNHYSTARDMAILTRAALQNEKFAEICALRSQKVDMDNRSLSVYNHNKLLRMYDGCIGVKTGFTKKSGRCLISAAERAGVTFIAVTLGAADDWNAHMSMLDYGFSQVMCHNGTAELTDAYAVPLVGGIADSIKVMPSTFDGALVKRGEKAEFTVEIRLPRFLYAPVEKGQVVGDMVCYLNGEEVATLDMLATEHHEFLESEEKKPGFFARLFGWGKDSEL